MHPNIGHFWPIFKRCMTSPPPSRWENRFGYFYFYFVLDVGIFFPAKDGMSKPGLTCGWKEDGWGWADGVEGSGGQWAGIWAKGHGEKSVDPEKWADMAGDEMVESGRKWRGNGDCRQKEVGWWA